MASSWPGFWRSRLDGAPAVVDAADCDVDAAGVAELSQRLANAVTLRTIDLRGNHGLGPAGAEALARGLRANDSVRVVLLAECAVGTVGARTLAAAVAEGGRVRELDLEMNGLGPECAAALADMLRAPACALETLLLSSNGLADEGMHELWPALGDPACRLRRLDVARNDITSNGARFLADSLRGNRALTALEAAGNPGVGDDGARGLAEALGGAKGNRTLEELGLAECELGDTAAQHLSGALSRDGCALRRLDLGHSAGLTERGGRLLAAGLGLAGARSALRDLDLHGSYVGDAAAVELAAALRRGLALARLTLTSCHVGDEGAAALAGAGASLRSLSLENCYVGPAGAAALAEAVRGGWALEELVLGGNSCGDEGAAAMARDALLPGGASHILRLDLSLNGVGDAGAEALAAALRRGSPLEFLGLDANKVTAVGAAALADALAAPGASLAELVLSGNPLGGAGAASLAGAVRVNSSLRALDLHGAGVGNDGARELAAALGDNTSLSDVNLEDNDISEFPAAEVARAAPYRARLREITVQLGGNHIPSLPAAASNNPRELGNYLLDLHEGASSLDRVTLKLVGFGGAGKTTARLSVFGAGELLSPNVERWEAGREVTEWARLAGVPRAVAEYLDRNSVSGGELANQASFSGLMQGMRSSAGAAEWLAADDLRKFARLRATLVRMAAVAADTGQPLYVSTQGVQAGQAVAVETHRAKFGSVRVDVLDFAGQLEFFMSHARTFFCSAHSLYLVCAALFTHPQLRSQRGAAAPSPDQAPAPAPVPGTVAVPTSDPRFPPNAECEAQAAFWLGEVRAQLRDGPTRGDAPALLALTFADKAGGDTAAACAAMAARLGLEHGHSAFVINGTRADAPESARLREAVKRAAADLARSVVVPDTYRAAARAVSALGDRRRRDGLLLAVSVGELLGHLRAEVPALFAGDASGSDNPGQAARAVLFLHQSMDILLAGPDLSPRPEALARSPARLVVLAPLEWLPAALSQFVSDPDHEPGVRPLRSDLPGVFSRRTALATEQARLALVGEHFGGTDDEQRAAADLVLDKVMGALDLCFTVESGAAGGVQVGGTRVAASERLLVFPSTAPALAPECELQVWRRPHADGADSADRGSWVVVGVRVSPESEDARLWPGLVSLAQMRLRAALQAGDHGTKDDVFCVSAHLVVAASRATRRVVMVRGDRLFRHADVWVRATTPGAAAAALAAAVATVRGCARNALLRSRALCPRCVFNAELLPETPEPGGAACGTCASSFAPPLLRAGAVFGDSKLDPAALSGPYLTLTTHNDTVLRPLRRPAQSITDGTGPRVFWSHTWADTHENVVALHATLERLGVRGFLDESPESIQPGEALSEQIRRGLDCCDVVVAMLSPRLPASKWCKLELLTALEWGKAVIPVWWHTRPDRSPPAFKRLSGLRVAADDDEFDKLLDLVQRVHQAAAKRPADQAEARRALEMALGVGEFSPDAAGCGEEALARAVPVVPDSDLVTVRDAGRDAFGTVHEALQCGHAVTVRRLAGAATAGDGEREAMRAALLRDAACMTQVSASPSILMFRGLTEDGLGLVVDASSSSRTCQDALLELGEEERLRAVLGAARGLAHMHAHGLLHGDLAARKVTLDSGGGGAARLADFGMGRALPRGKDFIELGKSSRLAVHRLAPEVVREGTFSRAADVYAFGLFVWEMYARRPPYAAMRRTEARDALRAPGGLPFEALPPGSRCPEGVADLMRRCRAETPASRPDMAAVRATLEEQEQLLAMSQERLEDEYGDFEELGLGR